MARNSNWFSTNSNILYIILGIVLLVIILFALFYPRKYYQSSLQNGQSMQENPMMESFDAALMENLTDLNDPSQVMKSSDPMIIMFYAPWCGHCKAAKPEFEKLMKMTANGKVKATMINCDEHPDIAQANEVQGFPTIRFYPKGPAEGDHTEYQGGRTAQEMAQFISQ